jgi:hypothetical protein
VPFERQIISCLKRCKGDRRVVLMFANSLLWTSESPLSVIVSGRSLSKAAIPPLDSFRWVSTGTAPQLLSGSGRATYDADLSLASQEPA